jgi:hypothetical protein
MVTDLHQPILGLRVEVLPDRQISSAGNHDGSKGRNPHLSCRLKTLTVPLILPSWVLTACQLAYEDLAGCWLRLLVDAMAVCLWSTARHLNTHQFDRCCHGSLSFK